MATLELGVLEVAYSQTENGKTKTTTTGDVAEILESRYHVMETFFELRKQKIANFLAESMGNALQDLLAGRKVRSTPTYGAEQKIEAEFRSFLDANEMQKLAVLLTGSLISSAAASGISHRRKMPYSSKNPSRPAFVDTGLYRSSFRAVIKL